MNKGKIFEQEFKNSLPIGNDELFFYRFIDGTASWAENKSSNVRFQQHNMADCMVFYKGKLLICELKAHAGSSLPLSCIRETQISEMSKASVTKGVYPFIITFFYDKEECYALKIEHILHFICNSDRKSIPLSYFQEYGFKIDCERKRTRYKYDLESFLERVDNLN